MSEQNTSPLAGKALIVAILASAAMLGGFSWWFRYAATHRALGFWGAEAAQTIRDAASVQLLVFRPPHFGPPVSDTEATYVRDVSRAAGMTHLRNALLEDRSFDWSCPLGGRLADCGFALRFSDSSGRRPLELFFSSDCTKVMLPARWDQLERVVSCEPIAPGLREVFHENIPTER